jgi:hypothetical protein
MADLYDPEAYFARLDDLYIAGKLNAERGWRQYAEEHPWQRLVRQLRRLSEAMGLMLRLLWRVPEKQLRKTYRSRFVRVLCRRPDPSVMRVYAIKCAMHYHTHRLVAALQRRDAALINTF